MDVNTKWQLLTKESGKSCCQITILSMTSTSADAVIVVCTGSKYTIFISQSIMIRIKS